MEALALGGRSTPDMSIIVMFARPSVKDTTACAKWTAHRARILWQAGKTQSGILRFHNCLLFWWQKAKEHLGWTLVGPCIRILYCPLHPFHSKRGYLRRYNHIGHDAPNIFLLLTTHCPNGCLVHITMQSFIAGINKKRNFRDDGLVQYVEALKNPRLWLRAKLEIMDLSIT